MASFTSIECTASVSVGADRQLMKATAHHTMAVSVRAASGSGALPSVCRVELQGSHDGETWKALGNVQSPYGGLLTTGPTTHLVTWIRAAVAELSAPEPMHITVSIASADD